MFCDKFPLSAFKFAMRILGVDPGLSNTGYAVIDNEDGLLRIVEGGVITTLSNIALPDRLLEIFSCMSEIIHRLRPSEMAIEELHSRPRFVRVAILMGHARGVTIMAAAQNGIKVFNYQPTEAKRAVTGFGRADKQQVIDAVSARFGILQTTKNEHISDALSLAICHFLRTSAPATKNLGETIQ